MRPGRDSATPCAGCGRVVLTSEIVRWPERDRIYWFLTGMCRECDRLAAPDPDWPLDAPG